MAEGLQNFMDSSNQLNKKTIVKNTVLLYIRLFVLMVIGFITTRVVLRSLGEVDYGLNNAVAGFVALFGVLTGSLNAAISRFITYELGLGNQKKLNRVFSSAVFIQLFMAAIVAVLVETIGIWFLNNHMTIPPERLFASRWVLHFAVINTFISLAFVPYSATIISHEKMSIYAYVSIIEGLFHLLIAYLIVLGVWGDRLIFYSGAICFASIIINGIYLTYCTRRFEECHLSLVFDKSLLKSIGGFAGWNLFGAASAVLRNQGINLLFNIFLGPAVNAARGVSNQTSGLATKFSNGFMTALNPQITKSYASGDFKYMYSLVYQGTRMCFALFFLLALPLFIETDTLLGLWLVDVPEHTVAFVRIVLVIMFIDSIMANPLITIMLATGKIRNYQIIVGGLQLLDFPLAYIFLKLNYSPEMVMSIVAFISCCCMIARLLMLHRMIKFPVVDYLKNVTFVLLFVVVLSSITPIILHYMVPDGLWWDLFVCVIAVLSAALFIWMIDIKKDERQLLISKVSTFVPFLKKFVR